MLIVPRGPLPFMLSMDPNYWNVDSVTGQLEGKWVKSWADWLGALTQSRGTVMIALQNCGVHPWCACGCGRKETFLQSDPGLPAHLLSHHFISAAQSCATAEWSPWSLTPAWFSIRINADLSVHWTQAREGHLVSSHHWKGSINPANCPHHSALKTLLTLPCGRKGCLVFNLWPVPAFNAICIHPTNGNIN